MEIDFHEVWRSGLWRKRGRNDAEEYFNLLTGVMPEPELTAAVEEFNRDAQRRMISWCQQRPYQKRRGPSIKKAAAIPDGKTFFGDLLKAHGIFPPKKAKRSIKA